MKECNRAGLLYETFVRLGLGGNTYIYSVRAIHKINFYGSTTVVNIVGGA